MVTTKEEEGTVEEEETVEECTVEEDERRERGRRKGTKWRRKEWVGMIYQNEQ